MSFSGKGNLLEKESELSLKWIQVLQTVLANWYFYRTIYKPTRIFSNQVSYRSSLHFFHVLVNLVLHLESQYNEMSTSKCAETRDYAYMFGDVFLDDM